MKLPRLLAPAALGLALLSLVVSPLSAADSPAPAAGAVKRPNILFLFSDDQRADTIGALGNPHIKTPHLDQLVHSGFAFRNAFCMGGNIGAICTPSRTMLLSGLSLFHLPELTGKSPDFPTSMNQAGYYSYHFGKWGNSPHNLHQHFTFNRYIKSDDKERLSGLCGKEIVDGTIAFLKAYQAQGAKQPLFMYLAFANPHDPRVASKKYLDMYDVSKIPLPANYLPKHPFDNGDLRVRDELLAPFPRTPEVIRRHLRDYYAVITGLDDQVGRLLHALDELGLRDNTIIIYSSDHGLAVGSHGLMGKQNIYEDGMKVPLIFSGPGIHHGESDALIYLYDIYPTVCDLVGAPIPKTIDGRSFAPILHGEKQQTRDTMLLAYRNLQRSVRRGPWKLIHYTKIDKTQLFNLDADPAEAKNLADDPAYANRVQEMTALLKEQQKAYDDPLIKK